jgi:hypothetical protein
MLQSLCQLRDFLPDFFLPNAQLRKKRGLWAWHFSSRSNTPYVFEVG